MAIEIPGLDLPMQVSPNSAGFGQYCAVKLDLAGGSAMFDCIVGATNTDVIIGINQDEGGAITSLGGSAPNVTAGESIRVRVSGVTKAQIASGVARGDLLVCGAWGQLATAPALGATDVRVVGIALEAGTNQGDLVSVLLTPLAVSLVNA